MTATSWASTPGVRRRMQLQRERDTGPELALRAVNSTVEDCATGWT